MRRFMKKKILENEERKKKSQEEIPIRKIDNSQKVSHNFLFSL